MVPSGSSSKKASPNAPGSSALGPTGSPIKIGAYIEQTGIDGIQEKPAVAVAKAWVSHVNANGGINGHPVSIDVSDTGPTSATAIASATNLASDRSLDAVLLLSASEEGTVGPILEQTGLPVFGMGYLPTVWSTLANFFTGESVHPAVANENILAAKEVGATNVGSDVCAENPACALAGPIYAKATETLGMKSSGLVKTSATQPSYTAECLKFISANVDFINLAVPLPQGMLLAEECAKQGFKGYFGVPGLSVDNKILMQHPTLNVGGDISAFPWWSTNSVVKAFVDVMKSAGIAPVDYENQISVSTWAELELFRTAAENTITSSATAVTPQALIQGFGMIHDNNLGGLLAAPVTFTADKPSPPVNCDYTYERKAGADFTSPKGDLTPSCLPAALLGQ